MENINVLHITKLEDLIRLFRHARILLRMMLKALVSFVNIMRVEITSGTQLENVKLKE